MSADDFKHRYAVACRLIDLHGTRAGYHLWTKFFEINRDRLIELGEKDGHYFLNHAEFLARIEDAAQLAHHIDGYDLPDVLQKDCSL